MSQAFLHLLLVRAPLFQCAHPVTGRRTVRSTLQYGANRNRNRTPQVGPGFPSVGLTSSSRAAAPSPGFCCSSGAVSRPWFLCPVSLCSIDVSFGLFFSSSTFLCARGWWVSVLTQHRSKEEPRVSCLQLAGLGADHPLLPCDLRAGMSQPKPQRLPRPVVVWASLCNTVDRGDFPLSRWCWTVPVQ